MGSWSSRFEDGGVKEEWDGLRGSADVINDKIWGIVDRWDPPISVFILPLHLPPPRTLAPALATPASCPFVTVLGGAINEALMCPLIFLAEEKCAHENVSLPNPVLRFHLCALLTSLTKDYLLFHTLSEKGTLQIQTMFAYAHALAR